MYIAIWRKYYTLLVFSYYAYKIIYKIQINVNFIAPLAFAL